MSTPEKINMILINEAGIYGGGTENRIKSLAEKLVNENFLEKVFIIYTGNKSTDGSKDERIKLIKSNNNNLPEVLLELIQKEPIHLVQLHNLPGVNLSFIKKIKNKNIPVIYFCHDLWPICGRRHFIIPDRAGIDEICIRAKPHKCIKCIGPRTYLKLKMNQKYLNMCDCGISATNYFVSIFENHNILKSRWKVIKPWIDELYFEKTNEKSERVTDILFVGPLLEYKGFWILLEALREAVKAIPDITVKIIGYNQEKDTPLFIKYTELIKEYNMDKNINFAGRKDKKQLRDEYYKSKVLIFPTQWPETFGQVWAEALACGCKVIASDMPTVAELGNQDIELFNYKDPDDLKIKIITILRRSKDSGTIKKNGATVDDFSINKSSGEIIKIYKQLLLKS